MQANQLKRSYERALDSCLTDAAVVGTYYVNVEAIVESSGKVRTANGRFAGKLADPAALPCIARRFRDWVFPEYGTMPMRCHFTVRLQRN
jgi:hypothetical protein